MRRHVFTDCDLVVEAGSEAELLAILDARGIAYVSTGAPLATGRAPDLATETVQYPGGGAAYPAALHATIDGLIARCWEERHPESLDVRGVVVRRGHRVRTPAAAGTIRDAEPDPS